MPPTRIENIKRKWRYADHALVRAMRHLADLHATIAPQHPNLSEDIVCFAEWIDKDRRELLDLYRTHWGGTERGLWKRDDFDIIMEEGKVITGPKRGR